MRKGLLWATTVAGMGFLASCGRQTITLTYTNPIWDGYLADPFVFRVDHCDYACGTGQTDGPKALQPSHGRKTVRLPIKPGE